MNVLNLGILAHVDAGKTSLTERILQLAGAIDTAGSVDEGTTQTDTLALEKQRGITIKSAVVSFVIDDLTVNLIDTPGHPDFIAEVERVLAVLDGAVLLVSAVEGVQAQTRVLARALQRLRIPFLIFVNKIDRRGAQTQVQAISDKLSAAVVAMGAAHGLGTPEAEYQPFRYEDPEFSGRLVDALSREDDRFLADCVNGDGAPSPSVLHARLAEQTRQARMHPIVFGSATRGVGVAALLAAIKGLLPRASGDAAAPLDATVFKIERGAAPEKVAYVRMFSGTLHLHERLSRRGEPQGKATALRVFRGGSTSARPSLRAGEIGQVTGLERVAIGDRLGTACSSDSWSRSFPPPTLEAVVVPLRSADKTALSFALTELAEQDPLINVRQRAPQEFAVSLYGEVQKEVILATLSGDFGIDVEFRESAPICIERPIGRGAAVEYLGKHHNPFWATIGLAVEPIAIDAGVQFNVAVELGSMPLAFFKAVEESAREAFSEGNYGWRVTDCRVTMTHSGFLAPVSTAGDFRKLTPLVLMNALSRAKTRVYEPVQRFQLEIPADTLALMGPILTRVNARVRSTESMGAAWALEGDVPSSNVHELQRHLPALTRGEGVLECTFAGYRATRGNEVRRAPFHTPFDRKQYLARARQRS